MFDAYRQIYSRYAHATYATRIHMQINTKNGDRAKRERERESEENQCQKKSAVFAFACESTFFPFLCSGMTRGIK